MKQLRLSNVMVAGRIPQVFTMVTCPVHRVHVGADADGHLIGRCAFCAGEAADAMRFFARAS